jgi:hypothetical protein
MKRFTENKGNLLICLALLIINLATIVFAAGKIYSKQDVIEQAVEKKVDKESYYREYSQLGERLKRIEDKLDASLENNQTNTNRARGQ